MVMNYAVNSINVPFANLDDVASRTAALETIKLAASENKECGDEELRAILKAFEVDEGSGVMGNYGVAQDAVSRRSKLLESIEKHKDNVRAHLTDEMGDD